MMEKKIAAMRKALERAENLVLVYDRIANDMKWQAMNIETDENGDSIKDADGNYVYRAPSEDEYQRPLYDAYMEVLEMIEKMLK